MGRAGDSPGRCSTDLLTGCPLHPGDSALGPPFLLGPPKKTPRPCRNSSAGSPELASPTSATRETHIGRLLKSVAGWHPKSFPAAVDLVPRVEPPATSLCSPPAWTS